MKNSDLEVGDRVVLLDHGYYRAGPRNPFVGSEYECEGTVTDIWPDEIAVDWGYGNWNTYLSWNSDLQLVGGPSTVLPV